MQVSLLIPCHNAAPFLPALVDSIRSQQRPFSEVIFYDDHSTDHTVETARSLGIDIICGAENRGVSHARNQLAGRSTCEWLHFQDADDPLLPHFLSVMTPLLRDDVDVAICDSDWLDAESRETIIAWHYHPESIRTDPLTANLRQGITCNGMIVRRRSFLLAGGFDETLRMWEDADLHIRLALAGARYEALGTVAALSLRRASSFSHDYRASWGWRLQALERYEKILPSSLHAELADQAEITARALCNHRDMPGARRALALNHRLGGKAPNSRHPLARILRPLIGPWALLRFQEKMRSSN